MKNKINPTIVQDLFSKNPETVISAINSTKEIGNKHYIPILFDLLNSNPEHEIEVEITKLLGTIKDKESVNPFMRAIENDNYKSIRKTILTACWQNGLDFSTFLPVFIDLIVNEEWEIAFEAFTIIDNFETLPNKAILQNSIEKINAVLDSLNEQKGYFLREVLVKLN
jgi:HEAT repeat protein